jgi:hypothetical protein
MSFSNVLGQFALSSKTANAGTVLASLVPPFRGANGQPALLYKLQNQRPNWRNQPHTVISQLVYTAGSTAHDVVIMRPLNWARITTDVAINSTTMVLETNPGTYSSYYKYDLPPEAGGKVAGVADNGIAGSDYVAYQLRDGTWQINTVSSVSSLTLTLGTATPNITGGGVEAGSICFFFGVAADSDPATGLAHLTINSVASARTSLLDGSAPGAISTLRPGDPMIIYSANASNAGIISVVSGYYGTTR